MNLKILEESENKLLNRKDVKASVKHDSVATPKKQDLIKELATKYSVPEENIIVDYIFTKKGTNESDVKAKIYNEKPKVKARKEVVKEAVRQEVKETAKQEVKEEAKQESKEEGVKEETMKQKGKVEEKNEGQKG